MSFEISIAVDRTARRNEATPSHAGPWIGLFVVVASLGGESALGQPAAPPVSLVLKAPMAADKHPLLPVFKSRDKDVDGRLTAAEYVDAGGRDVKLLKREFKVFDADHDGSLSFAEFVTIPVGQPEEQRGVIDDPVILLAERRLADMLKAWDAAGENGDKTLSKRDFETAGIGSAVPGLESAKFAVWDRNQDGRLSREEVARTIEIAYGIRTAAGELLRNNAGRVVDWRLFSRLKVDARGMVSKADYFEALGATKNKEAWLNSIDRNRDGQFDYKEFASGGHRTDPVQTFLDLDRDFSGFLSQEELKELPADWRLMAKFSFRGFDEDRDGAISLREYQFMPHCNLLAGWVDAVDADNDGNLSRTEFRFHPGVPLAALTAEYFDRLDMNGDDQLTLNEFQFKSRFQRPNEIYAQLHDDDSITIEFPDYPIVYSPEVSPDGKWVAVDGWNNGQPSTAAHVLVIHLETQEVRDLGIGCIPHWSADGKRIGYSKYSEGVFIRDFDQEEAKAELIDAHGWSIHFARDGLKAAYVKDGGNFVIYDLASGEKRLVFPQGKSPYRYIEHNFAWSPDSTRLCFKGHRPNGAIDVGIASATGGSPELKVRLDGKQIQSDFAWHPDGKRILFPKGTPNSPYSQIYEIEADSDEPIRVFAPQPNDRNVIGISFSRDGKTFAFMTTNDGSRP